MKSMVLLSMEDELQQLHYLIVLVVCVHHLIWRPTRTDQNLTFSEEVGGIVFHCVDNVIYVFHMNREYKLNDYLFQR